MATECDSRRYSTKRELSNVPAEGTTAYNLRKKRRLNEKNDSSLVSESTIFEVSRRV